MRDGFTLIIGYFVFLFFIFQKGKMPNSSKVTRLGPPFRPIFGGGGCFLFSLSFFFSNWISFDFDSTVSVSTDWRKQNKTKQGKNASEKNVKETKKKKINDSTDVKWKVFRVGGAPLLPVFGGGKELRLFSFDFIFEKKEKKKKMPQREHETLFLSFSPLVLYRCVTGAVRGFATGIPNVPPSPFFYKPRQFLVLIQNLVPFRNVFFSFSLFLSPHECFHR